ncbi:MAG: tRNA pseudouridine(38-40) synthase TruA [Methanomicrobium sp.]|nr:tRNA pseudouridine(38-40) synthase TruA [Methanomicrobium sp.]
MRLAFEVSYIGTDFAGSQQQPGERTVCGEILDAIRGLNLIPDAADDSCARFRFSGRTDRGVSARHQIAAFDTDFPERAISKINQKLPADITFTGYAEVDADFNPRYAVKTRTYRYYFPIIAEGEYDLRAMRDCAALFAGEHDFTAFSRSSERSPVREVISSEISADAAGGFLVYEICGYSFIWNQVRCIAFALDAAGRGDLSVADVKLALESPEKFGRRFPAAQPEGLILWDTECGIEFTPMPENKKSTLLGDSLIRRYSQLKKAAEIWKD